MSTDQTIRLMLVTGHHDVGQDFESFISLVCVVFRVAVGLLLHDIAYGGALRTLGFVLFDAAVVELHC